MISKAELLAHAKAVQLTPEVVEKDYVLGWLLFAIGQHPESRELWAFKGIGLGIPRGRHLHSRTAQSSRPADVRSERGIPRAARIPRLTEDPIRPHVS